MRLARHVRERSARGARCLTLAHVTEPRRQTVRNTASKRNERMALRRVLRPSGGEKRGLGLAERFRVLVDLRDGGRDLPGIGWGT